MTNQSVKLISHSQPSKEIADLGIDDAQELVAYCARVSNPSNQVNKETSEKLIKYLIKNKHWSPLQMVNICVEIRTTRDIARQILRHLSVTGFQEFSQRYQDISEMSDGDFFVLRECRLQDKTNRQNSIEIDPNNQEHLDIEYEWLQRQLEVFELVEGHYKWALESGIAKEQARVILPEGNTPSVLYMNASLRTWIHYIELREKNGTQKEHMEIARLCSDVISEVFPMID